MKNKNLIAQVKSLDWNFASSDTKYQTHAIHRYSGKFIPQIARQVIELLTKPGDIVLDPYCGSGTTLLECTLTGRRSIGIDLNPLAVLISKVKTTTITEKELNELLQELENKLNPLIVRSSGPTLFTTPKQSWEEINEQVQENPKWKDEWFRKWFQEHILFELIAIQNEISQIQDQDLRNFTNSVFSDILRKNSNANGSYPNVMYDKNKKRKDTSILDFFDRYRKVSDAVKKLDEKIYENLPTVLCGDACSIPINDDSIDAVIRHPPYIGSIPYAEYGSLSLKWLGHSPKQLDAVLTGGKRQTKDVVTRFEIGFQRMIEESWRVMKPKATLFMLLGNPTVKGNRINLSEMAQNICKSTGFKQIIIHSREGINRRANKMGSEALLFFEKLV